MSQPVIKKIHSSSVYNRDDAIDLVYKWSKKDASRIGVYTKFGIIFLSLYAAKDILKRNEYTHTSIITVSTGCGVIRCLLLKRPAKK